jgi:hypothetical protein
MTSGIDRSAVGTALVSAAALVAAGLGWACRATVTVCARVWSRVRTALRTGSDLLGRLTARVTDAAGDLPVRAAAAVLRRGLFGRRPGVSAAVVAAAPVLALAANAWAAGVGYRRVQQWVEGTWYGTDPQTAVFLAAGALVALAAASAAVNSGLVPTTVLVGGPVFGVTFTRYGLVLEPSGTVSLPDAVGVGLLLASAFAVPFACAGFVLGETARRAARTVLSGAGGGDGSTLDGG